MKRYKLEEIKLVSANKAVRIMFQDEAGFGRINTPKYCWTSGKRPTVPCHHIREYRYVFGAMNIFLENLSKEYAQEEILLVCDGASWHKSGTLVIPANIHLIHIPPYTPEMNPIEQVWREVRTRGFRNEVFHTLENVIDRLCCTLKSISPATIRSITGRDWILSLF